MRTNLVKWILAAAMSMVAAKDRFVKAVGAGAYRSSRYHGARSRRAAREGLRGAKLARKAAEHRLGMPRGVPFTGAWGHGR